MNNYCVDQALAPMVLTEQLRFWLSHRGSMTSLMRETGKTVVVTVLSNQKQALFPFEKQLLNEAEQGELWVREVIMSLDDAPWLYGRSVISSSLLTDASAALKQLGNKPLGDFLFKEKENVHRSDYQYMLITQTSKLMSRVDRLYDGVDLNSLPSRISCFDLSPGQLLLTEVFLPEMLSYLS